MRLRHVVRCLVQASIGVVWLHAVVEQLDAHMHVGLKPMLQTLTSDVRHALHRLYQAHVAQPAYYVQREVQFSDASVVDHCLSLRRLEHATAELCAIAITTVVL
ncbi:hypothetical protein SDRG_06072 [Saprolegnia diclina VS20]|uniref:Secreted protein n=1 Tax=Saprolegnia diclina (strain VS20) TaxID=1156394 RepID=T0S1Q8_SAPDV|nr:hypothetical protein SDRG_06072 [Saprolegnia diclina VS20]EQC36632.1 hypothetical protein SDRG_06072 [Saprolegnia diclina VS20]|eukprot:XP_008610053.1 hypothetical protein SDRG_06072 [Saprolegnia diclina VS20]